MSIWTWIGQLRWTHCPFLLGICFKTSDLVPHGNANNAVANTIKLFPCVTYNMKKMSLSETFFYHLNLNRHNLSCNIVINYSSSQSYVTIGRMLFKHTCMLTKSKSCLNWRDYSLFCVIFVYCFQFWGTSFVLGNCMDTEFRYTVYLYPIESRSHITPLSPHNGHLPWSMVATVEGFDYIYISGMGCSWQFFARICLVCSQNLSSAWGIA